MIRYTRSQKFSKKIFSKKSRGRFVKRQTPFAHKGDNMSKRKVKQQAAENSKNHFKLKVVEPLTKNQQATFDAYDNDKNIVLHGYAGTGKTYISLYLALEEILENQTPFERVIIVRSIVPSREIGFLPGSLKEKVKVYEDPYKEICDDLFGRGDGYELLKMKGLIQFTTTSYLRGITFNNSIVIVDEAQNLQYSELYTTLTRLGDTSKLIMCGDFRQTDLKKHESNNSLNHIMNILKEMSNVKFIEFDKDDIVRSDFVRELIIKSTEYQDTLDYLLL